MAAFFCSWLLKIKMAKLCRTRCPLLSLRDKGKRQGPEGINVSVPNHHKNTRRAHSNSLSRSEQSPHFRPSYRGGGLFIDSRWEELARERKLSLYNSYRSRYNDRVRSCNLLLMTAAETFIEIGQTTRCSIYWFHMPRCAKGLRNSKYYIFPSLSTQEAAESYKPNISEFEDLF